MDIKIEKTDKNTALFIEANFDQIVADNFDNICEALARRIKVLKELETRQRESPIEIPELISTIRGCEYGDKLFEILRHKFNISADVVQFLLNKSLNELGDNMDPDYLKVTIEQLEHEVQTCLLPVLS